MGLGFSDGFASSGLPLPLPVQQGCRASVSAGGVQKLERVLSERELYPTNQRICACADSQASRGCYLEMCFVEYLFARLLDG